MIDNLFEALNATWGSWNDDLIFRIQRHRQRRRKPKDREKLRIPRGPRPKYRKHSPEHLRKHRRQIARESRRLNRAA